MVSKYSKMTIELHGGVHIFVNSTTMYVLYGPSVTTVVMVGKNCSDDALLLETRWCQGCGEMKEETSCFGSGRLGRGSPLKVETQTYIACKYWRLQPILAHPPHRTSDSERGIKQPLARAPANNMVRWDACPLPSLGDVGSRRCVHSCAI